MIFIIIFLIIIIISFFLAFASMKDFQEIPEVEKNSLYLIQNPQALTLNLINELKSRLKSEIISLERLFKGTKSALVVFGPKKVLEQFSNLNLLELEDYTNLKSSKSAWEMATKTGNLEDVNGVFDNLPALNTNEQFWFQLVLQPKDQNWGGLIRSVVSSETEDRVKKLAQDLQTLSVLVKVPRPLTSDQIYQNYLKRAHTTSLQKPLHLTSEQILRLLGKA